MNMRKRKNWLPLIVFLSLLALLPFSTLLVKKAVQLISFGHPVPADIVVHTDRSIGQLKKPWQNLAQGGEEAKPMLGSIIQETTALKPKYIRLDHIYDFYQVVQKSTDGRFDYNWTKLDQAVDQILKIGAKPFLSLSYLPSDLAENGNPVGQPKNWWQWQNLVQKTIEHYSGQKQISKVYYEVWNEPDLFGNFKTYGAKNYLNLYYYAQAGAKNAKNVQPFKIGGPATTGLYPAWVEALINKINQGWRIDFISWHHYGLNTDQLKTEFSQSRETIFKYTKDLSSIELIISEWGPDSEKNPIYDNNYAAIQTISGAVKAVNKIDKLFIFEIKDGRSAEGKQFWGSWGLLTHEAFGVVKKPRYWAVDFLNQLPNNRIYLTGEGSYVRALASQNEQQVLKILLVNFDPRSQHEEAVPVTINDLNNKYYTYQQQFFLKKRSAKIEEKITNNQLKKVILMPANSALLITLKPK